MTNPLIIYKGSLEAFINEMKYNRYLHQIPRRTVKVWVTAIEKQQLHTVQAYLIVSGYAADDRPLQLRLKCFEQLKGDIIARKKAVEQMLEHENNLKGILIEEGFTVFEGSFDLKGETFGYWSVKEMEGQNEG